MYQLFFVLAMLLSLALLGLLATAVWRVMAGSRLNQMRGESRKSPEELASYLKRSSLLSSLERHGPYQLGDYHGAIAAAAGRDRYLAELTAFSRSRTFRSAAYSLLVLAGAAGAALAASGLLGAGLVRALDGLLLLIVALMAWAILVTLASIHDIYRRSLNILAETMEGLGMEAEAAEGTGSARFVRLELAFFAFFLLLMTARYFLIIFLRVDTSSATGFAISIGSFLLLCLGLLAAVALLNRKPGRKGGA